MSTGKGLRELVRNVRLVKNSLLRMVVLQETLGLAHSFPDGQHHCEQLQVTSSEQIWEAEMRSREEKTL